MCSATASINRPGSACRLRKFWFPYHVACPNVRGMDHDGGRSRSPGGEEKSRITGVERLENGRWGIRYAVLDLCLPHAQPRLRSTGLVLHAACASSGSHIIWPAPMSEDWITMGEGEEGGEGERDEGIQRDRTTQRKVEQQTSHLLGRNVSGKWPAADHPVRNQKSDRSGIKQWSQKMTSQESKK